MKSKYILIIVLALVAAGLVFWYVQKNQAKPQVFVPKTDSTQSSQSLGAQVYEQQQNPVAGQVPETNPFNKSSSNPIDSSYKNPFQ